jgi:cytochrome P450
MPRPIAQFDPFSPEVVESPWEFFAALREEAPVYLLPNGAYHLVSRYEDIKAATMDTQTYSSNLVAVMLGDDSDSRTPSVMDLSSNEPSATDVLAIADPPAHTRQRRVSNRAVSVRRVQAMDARIRRLANELIDGFIAKGKANWVAEFAVPLPLTIIVELLGLPSKDIPQLKRWSDASISILSGINTSDELIRLGTEIGAMISYLGERYDEALEAPGQNLLGDLIREAQVDPEDLSRDEIVSMLVQLLSAGNETTSSLIGSAVMRLLEEPALLETLIDEPKNIEPFVEEVLRLEAPFHGHFRVVKKPVVLAGTALEPGDRLMLLWSSSGRDATVFSDPDEVRLDRENIKAHLAFGHGIHHCIGAALARREASIALETLLTRTKNLRLAADNDLKHVPSLFVRSLQTLNIEFDPRD